MTNPLEAPPANWHQAWTQLTGYVIQARDDGDQIDPAELLVYMNELRMEAMAPIMKWMRGMSP